MYTIFIGYFNNRIYAVSEDKKLVKYYMQYHRGLDSSDFIIKEKEVTDTDMVLHYDDYLIEEYYGFYIPRIDCNIIEMDLPMLDMEVENLVNNMKRFTILISHLKGSEKDVDMLVKAIQLIIKYTTNKKYKKLMKENIRSHSILYCNINEYNKLLNMHQEIRSMNGRYLDAWGSE